MQKDHDKVLCQQETADYEYFAVHCHLVSIKGKSYWISNALLCVKGNNCIFCCLCFFSYTPVHKITQSELRSVFLFLLEFGDLCADHVCWCSLNSLNHVNIYFIGYQCHGHAQTQAPPPPHTHTYLKARKLISNFMSAVQPSKQENRRIKQSV